MTSHLVLFGREIAGSAYVQLITALESSRQFVEVLDAGYLVRSDRSADELLADLTAVVGPDEPIVVLPVASGASSGGVPDALRTWVAGRNAVPEP